MMGSWTSEEAQVVFPRLTRVVCGTAPKKSQFATPVTLQDSVACLHQHMSCLRQCYPHKLARLSKEPLLDILTRPQAVTVSESVVDTESEGWSEPTCEC